MFEKIIVTFNNDQNIDMRHFKLKLNSDLQGIVKYMLKIHVKKLKLLSKKKKNVRLKVKLDG